ncbi:MAG: type III secretion system chaperone [Pseudomonadota bacterium]
MLNSDHINPITEEFGDMIGVPGLQLDTDGRASLKVGQLDVGLLLDREDQQIFWLFVSFGELSDDEEAPAFLMQVNFLSWLGDTMTIAIDEDGPGDGYRVIGYNAIPTSILSAEILSHSFQRFCNAALVIHSRLDAADYSPLDESLVTDAPSIPMDAMFRV